MQKVIEFLRRLGQHQVFKFPSLLDISYKDFFIAEITVITGFVPNDITYHKDIHFSALRQTST